ncbi:MAG TPA: metallophosphoesterase [Chloroflexota bacterium]|nr:metallophosphoesterase [Chloroflexota bacterium]
MTSRAVVLADTHMYRRARELPAAVLKELSQADLVFHLGDFTDPALLDLLHSFAPVHAVYGNNDPDELKQSLPRQKVVEISGYRVAMLHGHKGGKTALAAARNVDGADMVLFGHSHRPAHRVEDGRVLFNPGSPTDRRWWPARSFGVLVIGDRIEPHLIPLVDDV